jgi:hypothetical protein
MIDPHRVCTAYQFDLGLREHAARLLAEARSYAAVEVKDWL